MKASGKQRNNLTYHLSSGIGARITPKRIPPQPRTARLRYLVFGVFVVLLHPLMFFSNSAYAWSDDPNVNTPICTIGYDQINPQITSDGSGGAIITWEDKRSSNILLESSDIYAQRVNASGDTQWIANGVGICTAVNYQQHPKIISDGSGGAIITWEDYRGIYSDIYAQRVNASGIFQWGLSTGVPICTAGNAQYKPQIINDGSGGAIILWTDDRSDYFTGLYAERVSTSGYTQWTTNGTAIRTESVGHNSQTLTSDGSGGALIIWTDHRSGGSETYARRINNWGVPQWWSALGTGVPICTSSNYQYKPQIISDDSAGAIITWEDSRAGGSDIYAQRINWWGELEWTTSGVPICTSSNYQYKPQIISDDSGGAIITWEDWRSSSNCDIYAQRVNASGIPQWTANGVPICTASGDQSYPALISDGAGGAVITWEDYRSGSNWDIYAQLISKDGTLGKRHDKELRGLPWLFLLLDE
jgi:hypothetical protein